MTRSRTLGARRTSGKLSALWVGALLGMTAGTPSLAAQRVWHNTLYPYAYYTTLDGFWGGGHYRRSSPLGYVEGPEAQAAALSFDAGASTQGSYRLLADAFMPALWNGWRLRVTLGAARENRFGFYGLGNDTPRIADSVTADARFYQASRTYHGVRVTLQRRLVGPLRVLAGAGITHTEFGALSGGSLFAKDSAYIPFTDRTIRVGLVLDTRDHEFSPHSGLMAEALFTSGPGYTRTTGSARVFLHPHTRVVVAARLAGEGTGGNLPLAAQLEMESSERPFRAVGGYHSLRGYRSARFVGPGKLLGGLELRYAPVWAPTVAELQIVGFYDAGRVFGPGEHFSLTTAGLHQSGGAEVAARFLRDTFVVVGVGVGSEGARTLIAAQWSY
jgi:Omp85 superfamily domain